MNFEPDTTKIQWLDLAARLQLERDLADLPTLVELLERNYDALLSRGDRNPDNPNEKYPIRPDVLDLADRRWKWATNGIEPRTLATRGIVEHAADPAGEADLARRIGARRLGVLPTLASWVSLTVGEMHDAGQWHLRPADPDQVVWVATTTGEIRATKPGPTVASEAGWLLRHLDWIVGQQWVTELADELRRIVEDLARLGVTMDGPHHHACLTADQIADQHPVSRATVYRWWKAGMLTDVGKVDRKRVFVVHEVKALISAPPFVKDGPWMAGTKPRTTCRMTSV